MSEQTPVVASPAAPVAAAPATSEAKVVKAKKPRAPSSGNKTTYLEMITAALRKLNERSGSSRVAILKYIVSNYPVDAKTANQHVKVALKSAVKSSQLKQTSGVGASGSFKIGDALKQAEKLAAKKAAAAAKPKPAKKTVAKKPASAKKLVTKKPAAKKAVAGAKKSVAKKPAAKAPVAGAATKKKVVKKPTAKVSVKAVTKGAKKPVAAAAKKPTVKKAVAGKKPVAKKPATKKAAPAKKA